MADMKQSALVTGAGTGIGRAVAERLGTDQPIILLGRRRDPLEDTARRIGKQARVECCDVSDAEAVAALSDRLAADGVSLSAVVHAAGIVRSGALDQPRKTLWQNWRDVIATNLTGAFYVASGLAALLQSPGGRVVFISSIAAKTGGSGPGSSIYAASKAGLHGLTAAMARELAPKGITVNAVAPGFVAGTGFTGAWPQSRVDAIVAQTPVARAGRPEEIAATVAFLCGPEAGFITGEVVHQNGGWWMGD